MHVVCDQGGVDVCNTQGYNHSSRDKYTDVQTSVISSILFS